MKETNRFLQTVLGAADFPTEILAGAPVVEIHGDTEVIVLHHRGVLAYDPTKVVISSGLGPVSVLGKDLVLFRMNRERIILHGTVYSVRFGEESH